MTAPLEHSEPSQLSDIAPRLALARDQWLTEQRWRASGLTCVFADPFPLEAIPEPAAHGPFNSNGDLR